MAVGLAYGLESIEHNGATVLVLRDSMAVQMPTPLRELLDVVKRETGWAEVEALRDAACRMTIFSRGRGA